MKLRITIEGKTYDVDVEVVAESPAPEPEPARTAKPTPPAAPPPRPRGIRPQETDDGICRSPLAGLVISVAAHAGQAVGKGDLLLVLEAMKMETKIGAAAAGVVKAVRVAAGDAVKPGQVLVEFE
jgi:biotin carboxyl carrier protein